MLFSVHVLLYCAVILSDYLFKWFILSESICFAIVIPLLLSICCRFDIVMLHRSLHSHRLNPPSSQHQPASGAAYRSAYPLDSGCHGDLVTVKTPTSYIPLLWYPYRCQFQDNTEIRTTEQQSFKNNGLSTCSHSNISSTTMLGNRCHALSL